MAVREPAWNYGSACRAVGLAAALDQEPDAFVAVAQPYPGAEEQSAALQAGRLNSGAGAFAKAWTALVRAFPPREAPRRARWMGVKMPDVETSDAQASLLRGLPAFRAAVAGAVPRESVRGVAPEVPGVLLQCRIAAEDAMARWGLRVGAALELLACREPVPPQADASNHSRTPALLAFPAHARERSSRRSPELRALGWRQHGIVLPPAPVQPPRWPVHCLPDG